MVQTRRATIVGAGVSGLTTAAALAEAGWSVAIVARETHEDTVSSVAAAGWSGTESEPADKARRWALASRERFERIAEDPSAGVRPLHQRELHRVDPGPSWWEGTPYVRRLEVDEVPEGYAAGFAVDGFIIEPPRYLRWLRHRLSDQGIEITIGAIERLDEVGGDLVVNCSGLGARELAADDSMHPIRGQVVAVRNPGIIDGVRDESDPDRITYVYPRAEEIVLGGTRQAGADDLTEDPATTERVLADTATLDPRLADAEVIEVRVGLRPGRPEVRVEAATTDDGRPLVHNYGHGGAGFILSWGCALDVVGLAGSPQAPSPC